MPLDLSIEWRRVLWPKQFRCSAIGKWKCDGARSWVVFGGDVQFAVARLTARLHVKGRLPQLPSPTTLKLDLSNSNRRHV
jgi:hypothetical protein